jgi:hypothetical protein
MTNGIRFLGSSDMIILLVIVSDILFKTIINYFKAVFSSLHFLLHFFLYFFRNVQLAHIRMQLDLVECFVIHALLMIFLIVLLMLLFEVF